MLLLVKRGVWRMRGNQVRPLCRGRVRCTKESIGRCFLMGGWNGGLPVQR